MSYRFSILLLLRELDFLYPDLHHPFWRLIYRITENLTPIIGDGDSLCDAYRQQYATLIHHNPDQETNDQTKAVHYLHAQGMRRIAIVGATGKREDHTIGNLSLLIEYMRLGMEVRTYTDYGVFVPCRGTHTFPSRLGQQVSIFNFTAR